VTVGSVAILSRSPGDTAAIGSVLAGWLRDGDVILLHGDLGAGKTTLAKGIAAALGIGAVVSSPSFALVNEYEVDPGRPVTRLHHLDLYRLQRDEVASIGFADYASPTAGVTLVEWPERAADQLPDRFLLIEIEAVGPEQRRFRFRMSPDDEDSSARFAQLRALLPDAAQ
jgi:tRNA threonylcarbamoyladenosine biosynthesis protein TsaE